MTSSVTTPVKPEIPERNGNGRPPSNGHEPAERPWQRQSRRRSIWPFVLDLGLAVGLFGLIIAFPFLMVVGGFLFVIALAGWIREARAEYARLAD